jgi:hypothetical protein
MKQINVMLAKFLFLLSFAGYLLGIGIYALLGKAGLPSDLSAVASGIITFLAVAVATWTWSGAGESLVKPGRESRSTVGHVFVVAGNIVMIVAIISLLVSAVSKIDPVVGGVIVMVGSGASWCLWLIGYLVLYPTWARK